MTPEEAGRVREVMRRVERSIARYSGDDSTDVVQEAAMRAVHRAVPLDAEPWLRTVARRITIDRARRAREIASGSATDLDRFDTPIVAAPEDAVIQKERYGTVSNVLNTMPPRYREALLTYAEGRETADVSRAFGISAGATRTLLSRARVKLRKELDRVGYTMGVLAVRFQHLQSDAVTAGAALCVAVAASLPAAPAAQHRPPDVGRTAASSIDVSADATRPVPVANAAVTRQKAEVGASDVSVPATSEVVHYKVRTCGPNKSPGPLRADVSVDQKGADPQVSTAAKALPTPLRQAEAGTC